MSDSSTAAVPARHLATDGDETATSAARPPAGDSAAEVRRQQFHDDVAGLHIKGGKTGSGGATQPLGLLAMLVGVIGAFALYGVSLGQDDLRNIASFQIMAVGFLALAVLGAALYITGSLSKLLRLWLLRQLMEQQGHVDQISDALRGDTTI